MRDFIENMEAAAEARAEELYDGRVWKCASCLKKIKPGHEQPGGDSPYAMPLCPDCCGPQE